MPRLLRMRPMDATVIPLPTELTTPPVTKMYFAMLLLWKGVIFSPVMLERVSVILSRLPRVSGGVKALEGERGGGVAPAGRQEPDGG